jgi:exopolysaccharide/PEP-CTERM locus tyrosine autokinase
MSVVERALRNLKKAAGAAPASGDRRLIARVADREPAQQAGAGFSIGRQAVAGSERVVEFDLAALRDAGLFPVGNRRLADEYRIIKRPVLKAIERSREDGSRRSNLVMIASALPGEGKTFMSVNLSMSLSNEKDWNVLLVDADCRRPELSRLLGVSDQRGLLDLLRDPGLSLGSLVLSTNIERLYVLPLGTPADDASELISSARMSEICDSLAHGENQIAIWDSSPLLMTTEAAVLSGQCGQVLVVVNAGTTPQQAVVDAVEKLDPGAAIGLIMNRAAKGADLRHYGGYHGYYQSADVTSEAGTDRPTDPEN